MLGLRWERVVPFGLCAAFWTAALLVLVRWMQG